MTLPTNFTDATTSAGTHPDAHNATNAAVNANTAALGAQRARLAPVGSWLPAWPYIAVATATIAGAQMRMTRIHADVPFDAVGFEVTTQVAATTVGAALYNVDGRGAPTSIAAQGSADASTIGMKTVSFTALPAGTYWLAFIPTGGAPVMRVGSHQSWILPFPTQPALSAIYNAWTVTTASSFPNPFAGTPVITATMIAAVLRAA